MIPVAMVHIQLTWILRNKTAALTRGTKTTPVLVIIHPTSTTPSMRFLVWTDPDLPSLLTAKANRATGHTDPSAGLNVLLKKVMTPKCSHDSIIAKGPLGRALVHCLLVAD